MSQNFNNRIIELIKLNKNDLEIKNIIFKEYDIPLTEKSINEKRNIKIKSKNKSTVSNDRNIQLVKETIQKYAVAKTRKDIQDLILKDFDLIIDKDEMRQILWTDLRKELVYNTEEYTFSLKSSYIEKENMVKTEQIVKSHLINSSPRIIFSVNDLVLEKIKIFKISYYNRNPTNQIVENNAIVEKLLISSLSKINIDKQLSTAEENKYILYGCISSRDFLNELKLILQCFIKKQTKLNESEIKNYLKIVCNVELKTIDLKKLLSSDLSFLLNRESIYYTVLKSKALNDLHKEVTNELFFYNSFVETFSTEGNKSDKVTAEKELGIIDRIENGVNITNPTNTKIEKKSDDKCMIINEPNISVRENEILRQEQLIKTAKKIEKNLVKLNKLLIVKESENKSKNKYWDIKSGDNIKNNIFFDFSNKTLIFKSIHNKSKSDLFKEFLNNLSNQRNLNRNPEVDLFFENLQEFYEDL